VIVLGIDPSTKRPAFCKADINLKAVEYSKPKKADISFWYKLARSVRYVFIEDQYLGYNYQSSKTLTFSAGELSGVFKLAGAEVILVPPSTWQAAVLGVNQHTKREQRKRISMTVASDITGHKIKDADIADAVCIAYYGIKVYLENKQ